jgi:uncharacterized membrane protein YhhN
MTARAVLVAFWVIAAAHLVSLAAGITWLEWASKSLLMPCLALWVLLRRGPRLIVAALAFSAAGDITLQFDRLFIVGMGFFAAAHVCYVAAFVRRAGRAGLRRRWPVLLAYGVVWVALVVLLWPGLGALQVPVAAYSLLLTATAATSFSLGPRAGVGGALFFISDGLIALRLAELPQPPMPGLLIMSTYIAAQFLLASSAVRGNDVDAPMRAQRAEWPDGSGRVPAGGVQPAGPAVDG